MKKILLSLTVLLSAGFASAQTVDTLTNHFGGTQVALYYADQAPFDSGFVAGNNAYGDLGKLQLFDATYGVTGAGVINKVLLAIPYKIDAGGSFQVAIWADNSGTPVITPIGSVNVTLASVDTTTANFQLANGPGASFYNYTATFATPVNIPANMKFWAGVVLPTGANKIALYTNVQGDFPAANTHTGEYWDDASFHDFNSAWGLDAALAIFPVVTFSTIGINENSIELSVYPNPANDVLNVKLNEVAQTISVISMDGKVVSTQVVNATSTTINVADLNPGVYVYEIVTANGTLRNTFVKK